MRYFLLLLTLLTTESWAVEKFRCSSIDDNGPYGVEKIDLTIKSANKVEMTFRELSVKEKYVVDGEYKPSGRMKKFSRLHVTSPDLDAYGEGPITPFFFETSLFKGGYKLRTGGYGGFIKTTGAGYSWANYICRHIK